MATNVINSLKFGDNTYPFTLPYGVCDTAAETLAKEVTVDNFSLETGATVIVKFTNANSIASPTLNVNGTGAKPIYRYGTTTTSTGTTTTGWIAGAVQMFTYDGSGWIRDYWNNTTYTNAGLGQGYVASCTTAAATVAKTASLSSYSLTANGIVSVRFTNGNTASSPTLNIASKGAKSIYYNGAALTDTKMIEAGDVVTFIYSTQYHIIAINKAGVAGTGISIDNYTINHANSVTAGTASEGGSARTLAYSGTFNIPSITYDSEGHVTEKGSTTLTLPAKYSLPVATSSALGGVKSGTDITVDSSGNVSVNDDSHNHIISNVDGLQDALNGKADSSHGTHVSYGTSATAVGSTASAGSATTVSRSDHTHSYSLPTASSSTLGGIKVGSNLSISSGTLSVPAASGTQAGVTIVYPAASCTTFSSDSGTITPLAAQKAAKMFAITRPTSSTENAVARFNNTTGDVKDSKITIEDVTNTKDSSKKANVLVIPAEGGKKMVYGYCTDQVDGTSFIGGVFDASATSYPYASGLAIGGTSGNLLWKGKRVLDNDDLTTLNSSISAKAALASPTFTGTPKAPTAAAGTNTTQIATTAFVQSAVSSATPAAHNHAPSEITSGTFGARVNANADAMATLANLTLRNIYAKTTDMTAGSTELATGAICLIYE